MRSFVLSTACRKVATATLAGLLLLPGAAGAADWREVELRPARFEPQDGALLEELARRMDEGAAADAPRTNINRRLVPTPPLPPLSERRALAEAEEAARWLRFAEETLQDGDVLFRLGAARTHLIMNFSKVTATATDSLYSHTGVFRWRDGVPEVVDITDSGFRVQTFSVWMREVAEGAFAVRRLKPEYRDRIPAALAFLERQQEARPEFDFLFEPANERYYCNEMTEAAFRSAGLQLSEAVAPADFPGIHKVRLWAWLVRNVGGVDLNTPMYVVGNETYGLFASDKLMAVYSTHTDPPPTSDGAVVASLPKP